MSILKQFLMLLKIRKPNKDSEELGGISNSTDGEEIKQNYEISRKNTLTPFSLARMNQNQGH